MPEPTDPQRPDPTCANCGHTRRGLTDPAAPCPECGARVAWPGASQPWLIVFSSALAILSWSIPALFLAWASPGILQVAREGHTMALVSERSWLLLLAAAPTAFALRRLVRCLPFSPASAWCTRLVTLAIASIAFDAAGVWPLITRVASLAAPNSFNFAQAVWPTLHMVILAAAAIPATMVLAAAVLECGLARAASRLWRTGVVVALGATALEMWSREGARFAPAGAPFGAEDADSVLREAIHVSTELAGFLSPLLITTLALLAWQAAAQARGQLAARPSA